MDKISKSQFIKYYNQWSGTDYKSVKELDDACHLGEWNPVPMDFMSFANFVLKDKRKNIKAEPIITKKESSSGDGEGEWHGTDNHGWRS